jgi:hypothetical protein
VQANKSTLADLQRLSECLSQFDELTVSQFCKKCESINVQAGPPRKIPSSINEELAASYARSLSDALESQQNFDAVLSSIKGDKRVRLPELTIIAHKFVGGVNKYKKTAEALKDIKLRFEAHMAAQRRLNAASDIF